MFDSSLTQAHWLESFKDDNQFLRDSCLRCCQGLLNEDQDKTKGGTKVVLELTAHDHLHELYSKSITLGC